MAGCIRIEEQRDRRGGKAGVGGMRRVGGDLVRLVQVVQPVPVDEAVLQAGGGYPATTAFEHDRASPSACFGVGQRGRRADRVERRARLVHRPRGPRPLQQGDAGEFVPNDRPAVAAVDPAPPRAKSSLLQSARRRACRSRHSRLEPRRASSDANASTAGAPRGPASPTMGCHHRLRAEVRGGSDADVLERAFRQLVPRAPSGPDRCTARRCRHQPPPARTRDERTPARSPRGCRRHSLAAHARRERTRRGASRARRSIVARRAIAGPPGAAAAESNAPRVGESCGDRRDHRIGVAHAQRGRLLRERAARRARRSSGRSSGRPAACADRARRTTRASRLDR